MWFKKKDPDTEAIIAREKKVQALKMILRRYANILHCIKGKRNIKSPTELEHIKWMLEFLLKSKFKDTEKIRGWIGYVQGILVTKELIDIEAEMEFVREVLK